MISTSAVRPAAVAGVFYPADARALRRALARHLEAAGTTGRDRSGPQGLPKMLVVPHAGYDYSGAVAALAYAPLARWREGIRRVVLLGPVHRVPVRGLAAPTVEAFETPLGRVPLDRAALASLRDLPQIEVDDAPQAQEHSLEVQLPFLQTVLGEGFRLVPLAVGDATPAEVAEVLERLWGGEETLVVISSDLSHFLTYERAVAADRATVDRILHFATDLDGHEACGAAPLNGALRVARRHGLVPRLLGLRNSADAMGMAPGSRQRVVGYGAIAFDPPPGLRAGDGSPGELGPALLDLARQAIAEELGLPAGAARSSSAPAVLPALREPGASFVTLHDAAGDLRGCIGTLEAWRPLDEDVRANARAAAFHDPRFPPLRAAEWPGLALEVSVLGRPEPMAVYSQADAVAALRPGIDGVILQWRDHRATYLPQVWTGLPDAADLLRSLKHKAGLAQDFWAPDLRLSRYTVRSFSDPAPEAAGRDGASS